MSKILNKCCGIMSAILMGIALLSTGSISIFGPYEYEIPSKLIIDD
jgi:hypothetical protein